VLNLVSAAGFHDVSVQSDTTPLRVPAPEDFLWQYVQSTPLAGAVAQVDEERLRSLERDVVAQWQPFVKDGALLARGARRRRDGPEVMMGRVTMPVTGS
jgi:hypothetical protein